MAGPDILRAGYKGEVACLMDLAPTILYLLGCPVPGSMDGNVLSDWLTSEWEVQVTQGDTDVVYSPTSEDVLTHDQEMEIIQRLKDLGYLE
jgi:arylsulfatase A-like enzyme